MRYRHAMMCLAAVLLATPAAAAQNAKPPKFKIVNVVDDFLAYHKQCATADLATRSAQWDQLLEARHKDFFLHVIYRKKQGKDRLRYKRECIRSFWAHIAPRMKQIAKLNAGIEALITKLVVRFGKRFGDFKADTDFYVTISFSFNGKVVDIDKKNVFALGLEGFKSNNPLLQAEITIAHELFHLYHFQYFSTHGGLYRTLWAEGLAVYASALLVPGHRYSTYLAFPPKKVDRCGALLGKLAAELRKHMNGKDPRIERAYFGAESNDTWVPPEAGYYVGLVIVQSLAKKADLDKLAKLTAEHVHRLVRFELTRLMESKAKPKTSS